MPQAVDIDPRPQIAEATARFIAQIKPRWNSFDEGLRKQALAIIRRGKNDLHVESARRDFLYYVKHMWTALGIPEAYKEGEHHRLMADAFNRIAEGKLKRLILMMPPRSGKSTFASEGLPTWYLGKFPGRYVIQISNGKRLASKFGAKVRDMFDTEEYQQIFPGVKLSKSTKGKEVFNTNKKGRYVALSMEARKAGEGGHLLIVDDPHSEQDVIKMIGSPNIWEDAWQQLLGVRMRMQKSAATVVIMQRWHSKDIAGRLKKLKEEGKEDCEIIEFPAIIDEHLPTERSFWEEGKPLVELRQERALLPNWKWQAVYQQKPLDAGANIIQREWWKNWGRRDGEGKVVWPKLHYVFQSWDTAMSSKELADLSACTTFGLFHASEEDEKRKIFSIILVDALWGRWNGPDLLSKMVLMHQRWNPNLLIIESKQSGTSMIDFLRNQGIHAIPFVPTRGSKAVPNNKPARLHSVAPIFASGMVYAPVDESFAREVIESCATAGFGGPDDLADSVVMNMIHFRDGRYIALPEEHRMVEREAEQRKMQPEIEVPSYF